VDGGGNGRYAPNTIRTMRGYVMTLVAVATLSGCGGSSAGQPRTLPAVTATTSPSAAASVAPTGIQAPTPEGATEFAKFFYAQITRAFATKNPKLVQDISLPTCKTCGLYRKSVTLVRDRNQLVTGGVFAVTFAAAPATEAMATARVDVGWNFSGATFYDKTGRVVERHAPQRGVEEQVRLLRQGDHWMVAEVTRTRTRS
jgi:hypothetical protein